MTQRPTTDLLDFSRTGSYRPEDRVMRAILRTSFVLFVLALEATVILAVVKLLVFP